MRAVIAVVIATLVAVGPAFAAAPQREATTAEEVKAFRDMAAGIPLGSRVKVHIREGRRLRATLMSVSEDAIVVKRESRLPEPAVTIRFDELARLQRDDRKGGFTVGKAIGVGLAAGAGAILTLFAIMMTLDD
jgi:hypothetical protein